ncbi:MAG: sodium:proton antiporter [Deltaproteobacteria bacterium]|nr:sodium:proton antiporter [Deltaproteobacteria bacterium]
MPHAIPHWAIGPFVVLLLGIATLPLWVPKWWEPNLNKGIFAAAVALPGLGIVMWLDPHMVPHAASEYISFIILIGSLYVISGGVVLRATIRPSPIINTSILGLGAILASLIGTTGASMVLIRPFLRANQIRGSTRHLPIFFIFIVSNAGGLLTPVGDPPLFLGYLRGVPFTWTLGLFPQWLMVNATLLAIFFLFEVRANRGAGITEVPEGSAISVVGLRNLGFLAGVVVSAATLPEVVREAVTLALAAGSWLATPKDWRDENGFTTHPLVEVAVLFAAIFLTMQPALAILRSEGASLGIETPRHFFFVSGLLSSVLDNAPTYLTFFTVGQAMSAGGAGLVAGVRPDILAAVSLGSVLMGANTYIGNGPNFMVRSIAEESGFSTPSFFGYMVWSAAILGPLWLIIGFLVL